LPVPHVDVTERFLFHQVEPKEFMVFRCVARYGYRDALETAGDFVKILVEYLQYYVRDLNLYGVGGDEPLKIVFHSARVDSFTWERKPSGHAIHAEEMLTPVQSFSELTMHPVSMSSRLAHFQVINSNSMGFVFLEINSLILPHLFVS
jgi:KUP system potassium uptake protein